MKTKRCVHKKNNRIRMILATLACLLLTGCHGKENSIESTSAGIATEEQSQAGGRAVESKADQETEQTSRKTEETWTEIAMSDGLVGEEDPENLAGALQECCGNVNVRIRAGNLLGSGVIYRSDESTVWIATAAHVLEQVESEAEVTFRDGYVARSYSIVRGKEQDIAFLLIHREALVDETTGEDHGDHYRCTLISKEAYDAVLPGDVVIAMGSKSGAGEEAYAGVLLQDYIFLEDFGAYMLLAEVEVKPGMSGGGLFDAKGNFLGILCGIAEDGEVAVAPMISFMVMDE